MAFSLFKKCGISAFRKLNNFINKKYGNFWLVSSSYTMLEIKISGFNVVKSSQKGRNRWFSFKFRDSFRIKICKTVYKKY